MPLARPNLRRKGKANEEVPPQSGSVSSETVTPAQAKQMPAYASGQGTVIGVPLHDGAPGRTPPPVVVSELPEKETTEAEATSHGPEVTQKPDLSGSGEELHSTGHSITLQGRTDADYRSSFRTENVRMTPAAGCEGCDASGCVRARGILISTYTVTTTVTLPSVNDFPNLTPCQRQRVQSAITNVLAPHEQRHVRAFRTYAGTTRQPFDMTVCRDALYGAIQSMHDGEQSTRQAAAQARSDALDPFTFDVDTDCEEPPPAGTKRSAADTGATEDEEKEA
jgi:hypothetical protein